MVNVSFFKYPLPPEASLTSTPSECIAVIVKTTDEAPPLPNELSAIVIVSPDAL